MPTDFQKDEPKRQRLAEILADPVLIEALNLAKERFEPVIGDANLNPVLAASRYQNLAGMNALIATLKTLTEPLVERKRPIAKDRLATELPS